MTLTDWEGQKWCRGARLQESLSYDEKPSSSHILQLHSHSSPGIPASRFLLCSATISALHPRSTPQHAIATAHRQEQGWTVMKLWLKIQIRHPRTSSYKTKPAESFTSAPPAHHGQENSLSPVSRWPGTSYRTTQSWRTVQPQLGRGSLHSFPKARGTHAINPKSGSWAGFCGWCCDEHSRPVSGTEKCGFLQKYMSASMALAHRVSVHAVMSALSFVHMPKAHYIQNVHNCAFFSSL